MVVFIRYIIIFLALMFGFHALAHDTPIAYFNLFENDHVIYMEIEVDLKTIEHAVLKDKTKQFRSSKERDKLVKTYLLENIAIDINGKEAKIKIGSIKEIKGHHLFIKAQVRKETELIKKINFYNTCLLEEKTDQNNILLADVNCVTRGFRLTNKRKFVVIDY